MNGPLIEPGMVANAVLAFQRLDEAGRAGAAAMRALGRIMPRVTRLARGHLRERQAKGRRRHIRRLKAERRRGMKSNCPDCERVHEPGSPHPVPTPVEVHAAVVAAIPKDDDLLDVAVTSHATLAALREVALLHAPIRGSRYRCSQCLELTYPCLTLAAIRFIAEGAFRLRADVELAP